MVSPAEGRAVSLCDTSDPATAMRQHMCATLNQKPLAAMTTTTIRLEDDLKSRVAAAAERESKTAHAFMRDAIA